VSFKRVYFFYRFERSVKPERSSFQVPSSTRFVSFNAFSRALSFSGCSQLQQEIARYERMLQDLHAELLQVRDAEKEQKIWDLQRNLTQLKREVCLDTCQHCV